MNPNRQQFENVNVLPNLSIDESTNRAYKTSLPNKPLSDISVDVKATRWEGSKLAEATGKANSGSDVTYRPGATASEARKNAYNAASDKKVKGAKSGETAKREAARVSFNDVTPKKTIKINSGKAN
jgi:hypothetical protein